MNDKRSASDACLLRHNRGIRPTNVLARGIGSTPLNHGSSGDIRSRMLQLEAAVSRQNFVQSTQKLSKNDPNYGKPQAGTRTEERGNKALKHVHREMFELCTLIYQHGSQFELHNSTFNSNNDEGGIGNNARIGIDFGTLFKIYTRISDKVVGLLVRAKKYGLVWFEPEILFQGQDDHTPVILARTFNHIKAEFKINQSFVMPDAKGGKRMNNKEDNESNNGKEGNNKEGERSSKGNNSEEESKENVEESNNSVEERIQDTEERNGDIEESNKNKEEINDSKGKGKEESEDDEEDINENVEGIKGNFEERNERLDGSNNNYEDKRNNKWEEINSNNVEVSDKQEESVEDNNKNEERNESTEKSNGEQKEKNDIVVKESSEGKQKGNEDKIEKDDVKD